MRPLLNGEDVSEADLNDSANIVCLRQTADAQRLAHLYFLRRAFLCKNEA